VYSPVNSPTIGAGVAGFAANLVAHGLPQDVASAGITRNSEGGQRHERDRRAYRGAMTIVFLRMSVSSVA
jgi:hypothetical protein